jgi:ketosteroid isomerase-like protein
MSQDNVRIVQAVYDAGARGDFAALLPHLDPEVVVRESDALPYAGEYHGPAGFVQLMAKISVLFRIDIRPDEFVATGDRVIALVKGQFIPQDGSAPIPVEIAECWTLRHHKIIEVRPYYWNPTPLAQYAASKAGG